MAISVRVIPRSSQEKIVVEDGGAWRVYVHASPERGKANKRLCELIAEKLGVSKGQVKIVRGETNSKKVIEVTYDRNETGALSKG